MTSIKRSIAFTAGQINREFKKTTTATALRTSLNKSFNEENNGCARALLFLVHFFAVLCKTTTFNDQILHCLKNVNHGSKLFKFLISNFKFIAVSQIQFCGSLDSDKQSKWLKSIARFVGKLQIQFLIDVVLGVAVVAP